MQIVKSPTHPHIEWIEIDNDGILHECAILKMDAEGNRVFFQVNHCDTIDKGRLGQILADRNARTMELWDLMVNKTLNNGINALAYFHQYAKVLTHNGKVLDPKSGQVGALQTGTIKMVDASAPAAE
jgi:hypothetical protein